MQRGIPVNWLMWRPRHPSAAVVRSSILLRMLRAHCERGAEGGGGEPVEHRVHGPGAQLDGSVEIPQRCFQLALPGARVPPIAQRPAPAAPPPPPPPPLPLHAPRLRPPHAGTTRAAIARASNSTPVLPEILVVESPPAHDVRDPVRFQVPVVGCAAVKPRSACAGGALEQHV